MSNFTIKGRSGKIDCIIPDGIYKFEGIITIKDGYIKYIDNGKWCPIKK